MNIVGIHDGHNAAAALMCNGEIKFVVQEERPTNEKNKSGFPYRALELILKKSGLEPKDVDLIGFNGNYIPKPTNRNELMEIYASYLKKNGPINLNTSKRKIRNSDFISTRIETANKNKRAHTLSSLGFDKNKIKFIDHHTLHADTAYYGNGEYNKDILVLTNDGSGDKLCATVSIGRKGKLERIAQIDARHSIGSMYAIFTFLTGMVPLEHEYKIMGMAPYVDKKYARIIADDLTAMFSISDDGLTWEFNKGYSVFTSMAFLQDFMKLKRFDSLMGGLQLFLEEFLLRWVKACIEKTGVRDLALAGGTFMNVKANQLIMELKQVNSVFVFPSCGDESNAIGICYHLHAEESSFNTLKKLEDVYFGIDVSDNEVKSAFESSSFKNKYSFEHHEDIEKIVAELLFNNNVVARFKGREEFGARSLGNRAILANPSQKDVIREINEMIKSRDFWMPFASSILDTDMQKYVRTNNKCRPNYMIMTYNTTPTADEILAGIHPYDRTVRPQEVTKQHNLDYWNLINEFKKLSSIGGVLNTSLNLHGLPLVHTPQDAFHVLENSKLKYLAIGNFLIKKTNQ
jgi:carbamoyltransferase